MDIIDFLPSYPDTDDKFFHKKINNKYEFSNLKLDSIEPVPVNQGVLMNHQKILSIYMSTNTLYDSMLVVHEMGTGKSCTAVGVIEQILKEKNGINKAIYLSRGPDLLINFREEYVHKCINNINNYTKNKIPNLSTFTFQTFAKHNNKLTDFSKYNNTIFILDEVHNLREQTSEENIYDFFHTLLHNVKNCKILLLSGTPMKDQASEIVSLLNLILPYNKQLNVREIFKDQDMITEQGKLILRDAMKGRVSYLKSMNDLLINKNIKGSIINGMKHFKLQLDEMKPNSVQLQQYKIDYENDTKGLHSKATQSILFAAPNNDINLALKDISSGKTISEKLNILEKYSSKYAASIRTIMQGYIDKKCIFVYNRLVQDKGIILFSKILRLFNFKQAYGGEITKEPRYALLIGSEESNTTTKKTFTKMKKNKETSNISKILNTFNSKNNIQGEIISVILGSSKISEGYTFKNIQIIDIHTPWHNYSTISQVISRGIRLGSHVNILNFLNRKIDVDIYQRATVNKSNIPSLDVQFYKRAEVKDIKIKIIEQLLQEESFDCYLNYTRNKKNINYSRDCNYGLCEYKCYSGNNDFSSNSDYDYTTYNLYYARNNTTIQNKIISMFKNVFSLDFNSIMQQFSLNNKYQILENLNYIILNNVVILNKYNLPNLLREQNNIFYLVNSPEQNTILDNLYSKHFVVNIPPRIVEHKINLKDIIESIYSSPDIKTLIFNIRQLSSIEKQWLLEANLNLQNTNTIINEYFFGYFETFNDVIYSWYLLDEHGIVRKCTNKKWEYCNDQEVQTIRVKLVEKRQDVIKKAKELYKSKNIDEVYYGLMRYTDNFYDDYYIKFCLHGIDSEDEIKKNRLARGMDCFSKKSEVLKKLVNDLGIKTSLKPKKQELCKLLFQYFKNNNILLRDESCSRQ